MTLRWYYSVDASTVLEITNRVRLPTNEEGESIGVGTYADAGSGWEGDIYIDDPTGSLPRPLGYRRIYAVQDAAPAGAQVVGNWFVSGVKVRRMDPYSGAARRYLVTMADENSLLSRRRWTGANANRGAETDIAQIRWALTQTELNVLSPDETWIDTTGPILLEARDLRDQTPEDMLMMMFQRTKKEHWIKYEEASAVGSGIVSSSVANPTVITTTAAHGLYSGMQIVIAGHSGSTPSINGTYTITVTGANTFSIPIAVTVGGTGGTASTVGRYVLCYFDPNTSALLPSTVSLSNDPAEIDVAGLIYPLSADAELDGSMARFSSGLIVPHLGSGKRVYTQNTAHGDTYAYVDNVAAPPFQIKTATEAAAYGLVQLAELGEPDDEVTTRITIAEERVNLVKAGMIVPVHSTYFPDFTATSGKPGWEAGFVDTRVKRRMVTQRGPETFDLDVTLSPMNAPFVCPDTLEPGTPAGFYPNIGVNAASWPNPLDSAISDATGNVFCINASSAAPHHPTPFYDGNWGFPLWAVGHPTLPSGSYDTAWSTDNSVQLVVVGPGTMTILLVPGPDYDPPNSGLYNLTAFYVDGFDLPVAYEERTNQLVNPTGITEVVVVIPAMMEGWTGPACNFGVIVTFMPFSPARGVGFGGMYWEPA